MLLSSRAGSRITTAAARPIICARRRCRWTMATPKPAAAPAPAPAGGTQPPAVAAAAHAAGGGGQGGGATSDATPAAAAAPAAPNNPTSPKSNNNKRKKGPKPPPSDGGRPLPPSRQDPEAIRTVADNRGSPFFELGLAIAGAGQGRTRVRQHVNPLRSEFNAPPPPPDWRKLYADPTRPLVVDVGCGQGRFLLLLARRMRELRAAQEKAAAAAAAAGAGGDAAAAAANEEDEALKPSPAVLLPLAAAAEAAAAEAAATATTPTTTTTPMCNYLGIEIREPLVERANRWVEMLDMQGEVAFCFANATTALPAGFLDAYPGPLSACLVQFPDPHFKRRHHKRRVLQPALAEFLRDRVVPGGCVFLQSDIHAAACAMRDAVEEWGGGGRDGSFELAPQHLARGGAGTFADEGPPADQVRQQQQAQPQKQKKNKKQKQEEEEGKDGDGGNDGDDGDDGDQDGDDQAGDGPASTTFVSEWSRDGGWLKENPIGVPTEREHYVTAAGGSVFRVLLRRKRDGGGGGGGSGAGAKEGAQKA